MPARAFRSAVDCFGGCLPRPRAPKKAMLCDTLLEHPHFKIKSISAPVALVFVLEDDAAFAAETCTALRDVGHEVEHCSTPHEFFYALKRRPPAVAIIDWMLPEMTGLDVVKRIRELFGRSIGVLMLTQLDTEEAIVDSLRAGADDYVVKPSTEAIVTARVGALLRRAQNATIDAPLVLNLQPYHLDYRKQRVTCKGEDVALAPREFDLAWSLFSQPGRLFTKEELLASIWGKDTDVGAHTVSQHVYAVRKKLALLENGFRLLSVYGTGYRLETKESDPEGPPAQLLNQT